MEKLAVLQIKSASFRHLGFIPSKYTCDGENINPSIQADNVPKGTKSLALIMEDPDAPAGMFIHWLMWNIPNGDIIHENSHPGVEGMNSKRQTGYTGPCPPDGMHHYHFHVFALDSMLELKAGATKGELYQYMEQHILARGELIGLYDRSKKD